MSRIPLVVASCSLVLLSAVVVGRAQPESPVAGDLRLSSRVSTVFTPPNAAPSMSVTTASIKVLPAPTSPVRIEPVSIASTEPWALTVRATNTTGESVLGFKLVAFVVTAEWA